jgi:hypothetical protein
MWDRVGPEMVRCVEPKCVGKEEEIARRVWKSFRGVLVEGRMDGGREGNGRTCFILKDVLEPSIVSEIDFAAERRWVKGFGNQS